MKASSVARKILSRFPKDVIEYFHEIDKLCKKYSVTFYLGAGRSVNSGCGRSGGYFDDCNRVLAVAIGTSMSSALSILVHEVGHLKGQWLNPKSIWHDFKIYNGYSRFFWFLEGRRIYQKHTAISSAIKRRWTKYINLDKYQRESSAYLYSYIYMGETGKWPVTSSCDKKIAKHAPNNLRGSYRKIPPALRKAFEKYLH